MLRSLVAAASLVLALPALPGWAGKPEHAGKGGAHGKAREGSSDDAKRREHGDDHDHDRIFSVRDRDLVRVYYEGHYGRGHCPPGLAKKHNGCLPPGLAKKRYVVGAPLPAGLVIMPLPIELGRTLGTPPYGYRYGVVDGDVVKLALGSLLVVDAIDGLLD